jgi:hypothetical protein
VDVLARKRLPRVTCSIPQSEVQTIGYDYAVEPDLEDAT